MEAADADGPVWGIVLAAGSGERFGGPKQLATVDGERCVDLAVDAVRPWCAGVVVALPDGVALDRPGVAVTGGRAPADHSPAPVPGGAESGRAGVVAVTGGRTRSASVRNALAAVPDEAGIVLVHDAAHPLAPAALFDRVLAAVRAGADAAVPVVAPAEAVKEVAGDRVVATLPRGSLALAQMPHGFRAAALRAAHAGDPEAVEDSELVERAGGTVRAVPGDPANVHVTTPGDLELARALRRR